MPSPLGSGSEAAALTLAIDMENVVARLPEYGELELELPPVAVTTPGRLSSPRGAFSAIDEATASSSSNIDEATAGIGLWASIGSS